MKQAVVFLRGVKAGILTEDENGYTFEYDADYLASADAEAVSLTLPLSDKPYRDKVLFPFFDGLIPEGWLLDIAEKNWKIDARDRSHFLCLFLCIRQIKPLTKILVGIGFAQINLPKMNICSVIQYHTNSPPCLLQYIAKLFTVSEKSRVCIIS